MQVNNNNIGVWWSSIFKTTFYTSQLVQESTERCTVPSTTTTRSSTPSKSSPSLNSKKTKNSKSALSMKSTSSPTSNPIPTSSSTTICSKLPTTSTSSISSVTEALLKIYSPNRSNFQKLMLCLSSNNCLKPSKYSISTISCIATWSLIISSSTTESSS